MPVLRLRSGANLPHALCASLTRQAFVSITAPVARTATLCILGFASVTPFAYAQTNLTAPVTVNQKIAFDVATLQTPTSGTYLVALSGRLRGEYILSVESPHPQTVHLIVNSNQYDNGASIEILDNHSYLGQTMLSNFRVLKPSGDAIVVYLVMDVAGAQQGTVVNMQYQGSAGYNSGFAFAGNTIPSGLIQIGGPVLAVNEGNVGIGTAAPTTRFEVAGSVKITPGSGGTLTFQDGTTQSTAWTGSANSVAAGTSASFGRITIGNSAPDGQGTASQGIVFSDTLNGTAASSQWSHAAIHSVGESGYNGDLVFSTDGDGQPNNNPTEKMRIMYNGRVGIGTPAPQSLLHLRSSYWVPAAASQPMGNGNLTIEGTGSGRSPSTGAAVTFAVPANTDGSNVWDQGRIVVAPDNSNNGDANGRMYLQTRFHSGNNWLWNNNLTLNSSGYVGVGTVGPQKQLSVQQSMNVDQGDSNTGTWDISLGSSSGEGLGSARANGSQNRYGLDFYTAGANRVSITNGGNFGIATLNPAERLDVNGNIKISAAQGRLIFPDGSSQSRASVSTVTQSGGSTAIAGPVSLTGVVASNQEIQSIGTNAGFRVASASGDVVNAAPWYGLGLSNLGWDNGNATVQLAGYFGINFQTRSGQMVLRSNGNVGIGASNPSEKLEVNGNIKLANATDARIVFADGTEQTTAWRGGQGGDFAESVDVTGDPHSFEPGDLLQIDSTHHGSFLKSSKPYSRLVGGVYATKPGFVGRRPDPRSARDGEIPMAMVGIVPTKVTAENGPIHDGDLMVSSSKLGYAMKGTDPALLTGAVIGKALGSLESGEGVIEVLISLQ